MRPHLSINFSLPADRDDFRQRKSNDALPLVLSHSEPSPFNASRTSFLFSNFSFREGRWLSLSGTSAFGWRGDASSAIPCNCSSCVEVSLCGRQLSMTQPRHDFVKACPVPHQPGSTSIADRVRSDVASSPHPCQMLRFIYNRPHSVEVGEPSPIQRKDVIVRDIRTAHGKLCGECVLSSAHRGILRDFLPLPC